MVNHVSNFILFYLFYSIGDVKEDLFKRILIYDNWTCNIQINNSKIILIIRDTCQIDFHINRYFYRNASLAIFVYDINE